MPKHRLHTHLENWRKYQHLWRQDKTVILGKFVAKSPSCSFFEIKLAKYAKVAADVLDVPRDKSVEFLQISSNQLVSSVHSEASAWVTAIGEAMIWSEKERVLSLHAKIDNWSKILHQPPDTLENLKMVLNIVGEILTAGMVMELEYLDLEERTRTRDLYKITNTDEDRARTFTIRTRLKILFSKLFHFVIV
ncbi:hypothetical protein Mapa_006096 [Marchantia paleacea]|nr:hypothetical protein Mapa_006096 [Marchantia paleacea]